MSGFDGVVTLREPVQLNRGPRSTFGEVISSTFDETLETNPVASILRRDRLFVAHAQGDVLDAETARARLKTEGLEQHLRIPDQGITAAALDILVTRKHTEIQRADVMARSPGGAVLTSTRLAVALGASLLDPLNIATGFVPVVGPARYAAMLAKAGGVAGRTAVRAGVGAAEGLVGAALVEPIIAGSKALEQADYDMADSLLNIGFGGVFGAGLHTIGGAVGDAWTYSKGSAGATVARVAAETRTQALRTAIAQAASGERVDVEPLVRLDEPDPFAVPTTREERLADTYFREQLASMRSEAGWLEVGGKLLREGAQTEGGLRGEGQGAVIGHTPWVPRSEWWADRPANLNEAEVRTAIDKALDGETLGKRQQETIDYLLDIAAERRKTEPFAATADELAAAGIADSIDARMEAGLVARALEVDEVAVERAAVLHENDPDAFLKAVKEIADRAPAAEGGPARAPAPADRAAKLDAVRAAAGEPKLSTVADERAADDGDAFLADNPQTDDPLAAVNEETADILAALKETEGEDFDAGTALEAADEQVANAKSWSAAARAAVLCGFAHK